MINVNALMFRIAAECQSTEETRYYLNGVYVHPHPDEGALLVATDGHRLIVIHDKTGKCSKPGIVAIDKKVLGNKLFHSDGDDACITVDDEGIASVGVFRGQKTSLIDGTFPDYARVVLPVLELAKLQKYAPASFNQSYVSAFGKVASMFGGDKSASMRLVSFTEMDPALIRFGSIDHAFGILMPMRSGISNEIPLFMKPILEPSPPATPPAPAKPARAAAVRRKPSPKKKAIKKVARKPAKRRAA
jgi:hypothetical protein